MVADTANPYLAGNFAPVATETTVLDVAVTGAIPAELDGRLARIGPNPVGVVDPATHHWFVGTGMVHGLRLREGRAEWYRSRFVRDDAVSATMGWPTTPGPRHGMGPGVANTNVIAHAGRTFAIVEAGGLPVELTDDFDTVAMCDFDGTLPGSFTAHPKRDPVTGELHAVVYYWAWDHVQYVVVGVDGLIRRTVDIPVDDKPMVHDCAITERYVLVLDLPCRFSLDAAMAGMPLPYRWCPDGRARVGLLPREGTADQVVWCELDAPCYVYHPLNAYDAPDGTVVMDAVVHPSTFATDLRGPNEGPTTLQRWTLDPRTARVRQEVLSDRSQEFPRHDERLVGRAHRYGYTTELAGGPDGLHLGNVLRHDLQRGTTEVYDVGAGRAAMEPVFVPRHADAAEDDGWIMVYVHDGQRDTCDVEILTAQDLTAGPVATVHLPVRVPFGFHGSWMPAR